MNEPPNIDHLTAHSDGDVLHWLTNETRDERFLDNIFAELCLRLQRAGIPVTWATLHLMILHPQWVGSRMMWADGMRVVQLKRIDYDVRERPEYFGSPANEIHEGATEVRENLERDPALGRKHAVYDGMRAKGLTGYVAWPLYHTLGSQHIVAFATDRPGGFDDAHIDRLSKLLPVLALVSEIRMKNRLARTLLKPMSDRMPANSFWPAPPGAEAGRRSARHFSAQQPVGLDLERVGEYPVRGFNDPIELFAYHG